MPSLFFQEASFSLLKNLNSVSVIHITVSITAISIKHLFATKKPQQSDILPLWAGSLFQSNACKSTVKGSLDPGRLESLLLIPKVLSVEGNVH